MPAPAGVVWVYLEAPIGLWRFVRSVFTRVSVHKEARVLVKAESEVIQSHNMYICRARAETTNVSNSRQKDSLTCLIGHFRNAKKHLGLTSVILKIVKR